MALSDTSEHEEDYDPLDSDDSLNDSFNSDDDNEDSGSGNQPEDVENVKLGNTHLYHSCPSCRFMDFDRKVSLQGYLWAKMKVQTRLFDEQGDCEFLRFCREQCDNPTNSGAICMDVELKDGRPFIGSKVRFNFSGEDTILPGQPFLTGRVHPGKWPKFLVMSHLIWKN